MRLVAAADVCVPPRQPRYADIASVRVRSIRANARRCRLGHAAEEDASHALGGLGLRSAERTAPAAYWAAWCPCATSCLSGLTGTRSSWKQEGAMQRAYRRRLRPGRPRAARSWRARAHRGRAKQVRASGHTAGNAMRRGFKPNTIAIAC